MALFGFSTIIPMTGLVMMVLATVESSLAMAAALEELTTTPNGRVMWIITSPCHFLIRYKWCAKRCVLHTARSLCVWMAVHTMCSHLSASVSASQPRSHALFLHVSRTAEAVADKPQLEVVLKARCGAHIVAWSWVGALLCLRFLGGNDLALI